jgi:hypothetical protein
MRVASFKKLQFSYRLCCLMLICWLLSSFVDSWSLEMKVLIRIILFRYTEDVLKNYRRPVLQEVNQALLHQGESEPMVFIKAWIVFSIFSGGKYAATLDEFQTHESSMPDDDADLKIKSQWRVVMMKFRK